MDISLTYDTSKDYFGDSINYMKTSSDPSAPPLPTQEYLPMQLENWSIPDTLSSMSIFVSHISDAVDIIDIKNFFSYCGEVQYLTYYRDPVTGLNTAVVYYSDEDSSKKSILLNGAIFHDIPIKVSPMEDTFIREDLQLLDIWPIPNNVTIEDSKLVSKENGESESTIIQQMKNAGYRLSDNAMSKAKMLDTGAIQNKISNATLSVGVAARGIDSKLKVTQTANEISDTARNYIGGWFGTSASDK
eukprot:TRINITY_DN877_c0_g1_i3.p1 TRINITY_DN877_c0_g1~~TRINITY_DN877_c0_g1_i3.p1  ORF type:complete len:245 (-),score=49.75 TRINITY_DN877_c0_g1_i3:43-777(-)